LIRSRRRAHRRCITQVRPAAGELEQRTVAPTVATTSTEWSPAERLVSGPAPRQGASRPSVDSQSVWRETPSLSTRLREHVREEVDLVGSPCSPLWLAEYRASQPIRAVDLHHALGHDRVRRHTPAEILRRIDNGTVTSLSGCDGSPAKTDRRLKELDEEGIPIVP
jgi:hypothetical protein